MLIGCSPWLLWAEQKKRGLNVSKGFRCKWELCEAGRSYVPKQAFPAFLPYFALNIPLPAKQPLFFVRFLTKTITANSYVVLTLWQALSLRFLLIFTHLIRQHVEINTIVTPILQVRKLRYGMNNLPKVPQPINGRANIWSLMPNPPSQPPPRLLICRYCTRTAFSIRQNMEKC